MEHSKTPVEHGFINAVAAVLYVVALGAYTLAGVTIGFIHANIAALVLLCIVVPGHLVSLIIVICEGKTKSAILITFFTGFWAFVAISWLTHNPGLNRAMLVVEPVIAIAVLLSQRFYSGLIRVILNIIVVAIGFLWLSKLLPVVGQAFLLLDELLLVVKWCGAISLTILGTASIIEADAQVAKGELKQAVPSQA